MIKLLGLKCWNMDVSFLKKVYCCDVRIFKLFFVQQAKSFYLTKKYEKEITWC